LALHRANHDALNEIALHERIYGQNGQYRQHNDTGILDFGRNGHSQFHIALTGFHFGQLDDLIQQQSSRLELLLGDVQQRIEVAKPRPP